MSEPVEKVYEGELQSYEVKNGWHVFHVLEPDKNYPVKLSTKKDDVIAKAKGVGQQAATWIVAESQGNPNPNKPGSFYMNRWLNDVYVAAPPPDGLVETLQATEPAPKAAPAPQQQQAPVDWDAKDLRIARLALLKVAASALAPAGKAVTAPALVKYAAALEEYVYPEPDPEPEPEPEPVAGPSLDADDVPF